MPEILNTLLYAEDTYINVYTAIVRWLIPILSALMLFRCIKPLIAFRRMPEIWAWLHLPGDKRIPITHWETVIGRSKRSDIVLEDPEVSRNHAVLTRYDDGSWTIADAESQKGVFVNGKRCRIKPVYQDDIIKIGNTQMSLQPISKRQEQKLAQMRTKVGTLFSSIVNVSMLTLLQLFILLAFLLGGDPETVNSVLLGFIGIAACQWLLLLFYICIRRTAFEVETIAFFLCTLGMAVISTVAPSEALKQLICIAGGIVIFLLVGWSLRKLDRAKTVRQLAAVAGVGFLLITLLFGTEYYGAKNWLIIGSLSIQPSELTKLCFVFVGASSMERILTKRNLVLFIGYTVGLCGCLALMNDFGTALIFFFAFLVIAYMRSGNVGTIGLACTALGFAGVMALRIAPHALQRFASWRHIWEVPLNGGYQQTRALMCMASGGLLGMGADRGMMQYIFAADSDMVVATLAEEWGLVMVLLAILCIVALAIFCVRSAAVGRNSFYTIGACTAVSILLVQTILNALGTVDILPLTGVTFPFLSNGGSSMLCVWGLLGFIKAADTRQNASFAVRRVQGGGEEDE